MAANDPFRFQARIRFIDTDASGRIHYTALFRYFESAEIEFLRQFEISYTMKREFTFPRVHVECDMMLSIVHDDLLDIDVYLTKLGRSSVRLEFLTFTQGELAAKGVVVVVCMDRATRKAIAIPDDIREKFLAAVGAPPQNIT